MKVVNIKEQQQLQAIANQLNVFEGVLLMSDSHFAKAKGICQSRSPFSEIRKAYAIKGFILVDVGTKTMKVDGKRTDVK